MAYESGHQIYLKPMNRKLELYQPLGSLAMTPPASNKVPRAHLLLAKSNANPGSPGTPTTMAVGTSVKNLTWSTTYTRPENRLSLNNF